MASADPYMVAWRLRSDEGQPAVSVERPARYSDADAVARVLIERFGARRVLLLGSGGRARAVHDPDVVLWVEGLPESAYLDAAGMARESIAGAVVELVRAEWAPGNMRARALRDGVVLDAAEAMTPR